MKVSSRERYIIPKTNRVYYKAGYKYVTSRDYCAFTSVLPEKEIHTEYIDLYTDGFIVIHKGYAWDGASGPTVDTLSSQRSSLQHDAGYQLIRMGLLPQSDKAILDSDLKKVMVVDGAFKIRARVWEWAVNNFARSSTRPSAEHPELVAP